MRSDIIVNEPNELDFKFNAKPRFRLIAHPQLEAWICYMIDRHGKIIATKTKLIRML